MTRERTAAVCPGSSWPKRAAPAGGRPAAAQGHGTGALRGVAALDGGTDPVYSDVLPAQELATYYAWVGNAEESLKYLRLACSRSPVGIDQGIVQSGVFDRVRQTPGFSDELTRLQDAAWPRVLEQRQRLEESDGGIPLASRTVRERRHGG